MCVFVHVYYLIDSTCVLQTGDPVAILFRKLVCEPCPGEREISSKAGGGVDDEEGRLAFESANSFARKVTDKTMYIN